MAQNEHGHPQPVQEPSTEAMVEQLRQTEAMLAELTSTAGLPPEAAPAT